MIQTNTVPLAKITPSTTNPRKSFPKDKLDELTDSVKRLGVLQPILLRPLNGGGTYELVAGERRYRASKAAGLTDIPATVRELTDAEVLEIQVIENLQRSDPHELEEAEGYERCSSAHPSGEKYTVDEIAAKVGKSRSYVFGRLKLWRSARRPEGLLRRRDRRLEGAPHRAHRAPRHAAPGAEGHHRRASTARGPMSYREAHEHISRTTC
jgi:ParB/RepB/Spo0J family partition protein